MSRHHHSVGAAARCLLPVLFAALPLAARAEEHPAAEAPDRAADITVIGERDPTRLDVPTPTVSRLGLTPRETPATLDVVTQATMQAKGLRTAVEVYDSTPGVVAGLLPGEPASASMRGFSTGAVSYLFDGMRIADSTILNRNYDSFAFDRIEVLKGPASILYGDGALAGAINLVPKKPTTDARHVDALASYGSFDSWRLGAGINQPLGTTAALRSDLSASRSGGYVDDTRTRTLQSTNSLALNPTSRLSVLLAFDYFGERNRTPYQGAPLLPAAVARDPSDVVHSTAGLVLDRAIRDRNYNVTDGRADSDAYWGRARIAWTLADGWTLTDEANLYRGDRTWENSEDFTYNPATALFDRSTTKITHDHDSWSNRAFLTGDTTIAGLRNRVNVGAEYNEAHFITHRRFGTTTSVSPFAPVRGTFPADVAANFPGAGNRADFTSRVASWAVFAEDALNLTDRWLLLAGLRHDTIDLDRRVDDLNQGTTQRFGRRFHALSGRIGSVYDVAPTTQLYAQYSHAITPVGSLLLSNVLRASVDLTRGDSVEGGVKTSLFGDRLALTAAGYWIRQSGILTRNSTLPSVQVQGGVQSSRGVELSAVGTLSRHWTLDANAALLRARFDELTGAGDVDLTGKRPVNVPQRLANLTLAYHADALPLTVSGSLRHVGDIYTSTANTVRVDGYTLLDAGIAYRLPQATVSLRVRNIADRFYAYWSGYSATQVYVGAPRSIDLTLATRL
ncbi:TonB-dependent receptor [Sphingomonas ginsenosidimutans]|uniref:TonB-dependent receptor n=2 Tax=Sphingomonas TaxID=13687 RepID=UPI001D7F7CEE|nr:TonB-dependent siderophore receptor [Sphingomonas ginsenosidimutans]MBY0303077.1 TonB-dependent siderophore receptor [Sphingomonas ginsenosidimutans]